MVGGKGEDKNSKGWQSDSIGKPDLVVGASVGRRIAAHGMC